MKESKSQSSLIWGRMLKADERSGQGLWRERTKQERIREFVIHNVAKRCREWYMRAESEAMKVRGR
jgi:hypothetical protein